MTEEGKGVELRRKRDENLASRVLWCQKIKESSTLEHISIKGFLLPRILSH